MPTPVHLPGFEGHTLIVESNLWSGKPTLTLNGTPVAPNDEKNEFLLPSSDGQQTLVRVKPAFSDLAPVLEVNGQTIFTARALTPFEWIWAAFPIVLLFFGGALGGGLGVFAAFTNIFLIRDEKSLLRYVLCAIVTSAAFFTRVVIVALLESTMKGAIKH